MILLSLRSHCSLLLCHHFRLKSLKRTSLRDIECLACFWSKIYTLSRINIDYRTLLKNNCYTLCLCELIDSILRIRDDRSLKFLLKLIDLSSEALLSLLES